MKKILFYCICIVTIASCKNKNTVTTSTDKDKPSITTTEIPTVAKVIYDKIIGSYVGVFGDNKITLLISKAEGDSISGRSVVGGYDRPFTGTVIQQGGTYIVAAKEPGTDKHDGTFNFTIKDANTNIVEGSWVPNDAKVTPKKNYVLQRKAFEYKIDVGNYAKASQRELKSADVENLTKYDLQTMRNEIFARHGYCFKKKDLRDYFENEDWYVPDNVDVKDLLTTIEKKNIQLIKRYEKYADDYGDDFGR